MRGLAHSVSFLFKAPLLLLILFLINWMTHGHWFRWVALGIGIAWVINLMRVVRGAIVLGGIASLGAYVTRRAR